MDEIEKLNLLDHVDDINKLLARYGVNFNLYKKQRVQRTAVSL